MVCGWARGEVDVPAEAAWQAELWRRLRERLGTPSPAERLEPACARLRADPSLLDLPERISLFGLTRLPAGHLDVLRALAAGRDVHVFLLHPSPALWEKIGGTGRRSSAAPTTRPPRCPTTGCSPPGARTRARCSSCSGAHEHVDHHHPVEPAEDTLLSRIQADVRADRSPPGIPLPGRRRRPPAARPRRPQRPDPRLPRPRAPGRGPARRDPPPARRGRHAASRATSS